MPYLAVIIAELSRSTPAPHPITNFIIMFVILTTQLCCSRCVFTIDAVVQTSFPFHVS